MNLGKKRERGFSIAIGAIVALVISILMVGIVQTIQYNLHQNTYLSNMERARQLAESATNEVIGQLIYAPGSVPQVGTLAVTRKPGPGNEGLYDYYVTRRSTPAVDCFYITTVATRSVLGEKFVSSMHSYVNISNTGDYLFAVAAGTMQINAGISAALGKVYAPYLNFIVPTLPQTTSVRRAEYANQVTPPIGDPNYSTSGPIAITDSPNEPTMVPALLFPQVLDSDIETYKNDAYFYDSNPANHHDDCTFTGDIFPPGYASSPPNTRMSGDNYVKHTNNNNDHVYYCAGNLKIQGTIHGQILFVSSNSITITGPLKKYSSTTPTDFPGFGVPSSSTAHEAVLITRQDVHIANTFWTNFDPNVLVVSTQVACETIEALVMAPSGTMYADLYQDSFGNTYDLLHQHLKLYFHGSMILQTSMISFVDVFKGAEPTDPSTFTSCTASADSIPTTTAERDTLTTAPTRSYAYDTDFKNYPPPNLPALSQVHLSLEQTLSTQ